MFTKTLLFLALYSVALVSATPVAQASEPAPSCIPPGVPGLGQACGFIWGTIACTNPDFKCCYLHPDAGYCLPACPTDFIPPSSPTLSG
ncbi:hypothetical protein AGABI1DRAFT_130411 [Agaricus bisporus var. burnettii JB137-S8]|uniref:Uncharacterized protein n=2 Tax=Agaricus bisporus var. burnettii TaxID=192524 RepID=K5VS77_AGABU|nr:uncharacterized protein AGABI1DRAFT_130411 [Agaricus bisporus var. burnettii JB137-S8]EKM77319.1 hypothetical protein AGABI1DRAFT_130411 [Agaricus bisporus var. burnettii JB137-S8]KAF7764006.1 hypothetical protein Agabi119p4_8543 [Agaricus bisporus var. burnettii]